MPRQSKTLITILANSSWGSINCYGRYLFDTLQDCYPNVHSYYSSSIVGFLIHLVKSSGLSYGIKVDHAVVFCSFKPISVALACALKFTRCKPIFMVHDVVPHPGSWKTVITRFLLL